MHEKLIAKEIAKQLQNKIGNCPGQPECPYGLGDRCSATSEILEEKFKAMKETPDEVTGLPPLFMAGDKASQWPCNTCIVIAFVEPTKE